MNIFSQLNPNFHRMFLSRFFFCRNKVSKQFQIGIDQTMTGHRIDKNGMLYINYNPYNEKKERKRNSSQEKKHFISVCLFTFLFSFRSHQLKV